MAIDKREKEEEVKAKIGDGSKSLPDFNWHPLIGNYQAYPLVETGDVRGLRPFTRDGGSGGKRYQYERAGRKVYAVYNVPTHCAQVCICNSEWVLARLAARRST